MSEYPNIDLIHRLTYFVTERDHIRSEKEAGAPAPWTDDNILNTYRFCNIRRKDDRVSKWIHDYIIRPYEGTELLWFMLCCARWINWPPTIRELMDRGAWPILGFDPIRFGRVIDERAARGEKAWTGAYMITARHVPPGWGKGAYVAEKVLHPLLTKGIGTYLNSSLSQWRSVEETLSMFQGNHGWGTFMAGQAVADMTYCRLLGQAKDLHTYAPIGPGSTRGLNRLFGRKLDGRIQQEQFNAELMLVRDTVADTLGYPIPDMTLHDWQNCMCEFDKYLRALNGTGKPRSTYKPETAF